MENQQTMEATFEKFTWTIKNFSKLNPTKLYSVNFIIGGYPWRILMYPKGNKVLQQRKKGNKVDYLSIYLDAWDAANQPYGWSRFAKFKLALINKVNSKMSKIGECKHQFNARERDCGFPKFIPLVELCDPSKGFTVDDTCIIEVEISVSKSEHENLGDQPAKTTAVSPVSAQVKVEPIEHTDNPSPKGISSTSMGELMDFRGLGKIQKDFVPLLEEVCARHPSLIECQQKRTPWFIEWAFTALGRVLHFLKTKKVKDMNDDACMHLQILWEELETFRFDLVKAEEGFEQRDLDVELGYGK